MKRKDKNLEDSEPKKKKMKKSLNFSEKDKVKNASNKKDTKSVKIASVQKIKQEKRVKFEKPVTAKKSDKSNTVKSSITDKTKKTFDKTNKTMQSNSTSEEKPNWLEFKKKKKELKEKRRVKRMTSLYDVSVKAKEMSEELRREDCKPDRRKELTEKMHELLKNQYNKIIFTHDMSRIIQWLLKHCSSEIREEILTELKPSLLEMFRSKYARNVVKTALKHGSDKIKKDFLNACNGNVVDLLSHTISAPIFEQVYAVNAAESDKNDLKQEFYGVMYKQAKDPNVKTLSDVYKSAENMKLATLSAVKGNLVRILNKKLVNSMLLHIVLFEFLSNCSVEDKSEMIVMIRSLIADLSQTKEGSKAAAICIWHATNKDKKIIMKSLKGHVKDIAVSEHGHMILLALFDCVDDTVLVKKIILSEMQNHLVEIASNEYGKRTILYLVARRDTRYFHPAAIEYLKQGDENATSKKPTEIRRKELFEGIIDPLLESIASETQTWLSNGSIQMVALAILKASYGNKNLKPVFEAIAKYVINEDAKIMEDGKEYKVIEHAGLHMILKKLVQKDNEFKDDSKISFGKMLVDELNSQIIKNWIEFNRGCFLLIALLENESESIVATLNSKIQKLSKVLKTKKSPGASILLKKLIKSN